MKNLIKKYWTHILNISFLAYLIYIFGLFTNGIKNNYSAEAPSYLGILVLIEMIMVIGIWVEIIYHIVKAAKNDELKNKGLNIMGIYLLNIFYIPCFSLNHISKDSNAKIKNIAYVLLSVGMFVLFVVYVIKFEITAINL